MTIAAICRVVAGALVLLSGAALAVAGIHLSRGGPTASRDIIANETTTRRISMSMIGMSAILLLLVAGAAVIGEAS